MWWRGRWEKEVEEEERRRYIAIGGEELSDVRVVGGLRETRDMEDTIRVLWLLTEFRSF